MDFNILIGGAAGQGMDTLGHLLAKSLQRIGFYVFLTKDYMSRIRGGHNFIQIRFSDKPIYSHSDELSLIIALNRETLQLHYKRLTNGGKVVSIEESNQNDTEFADIAIKLPVSNIVQKTGNRRVIGVAALGSVCKLFGLPLNILLCEIEATFDQQHIEANKIAASEGYNAAQNMFFIEMPETWESIFINGNESIALGAIAAGCKFYSGYPMTPATSIMTYLSKKSNDANVLVEQAEDEIAAVIMAIGASYAGVRAMTGTSGGGFSLMVEGVSLAGITETPLVIAIAQRPGPATGLPTRTEQGELGFVIHSGHGEFPRMVMALRNQEDAFYQTARAFNIAEKYQIPVFLLTDQYLSDYASTIKPFDFSKVSIDRFITQKTPENSYLRYALNDSGISPRIIPGKIKNRIVKVDSDEHDECGHIIESSEIRTKMVQKRLNKITDLYNELLEPEYIGCDIPETLILSWGSTYGPVREAVSELLSENYSVGCLIFGDVWPLPQIQLQRLAKSARKIVNLEQNATGQLSAIIRQQAMITCSHSLLKFDGRQWSKAEIINALKKEVF